MNDLNLVSSSIAGRVRWTKVRIFSLQEDIKYADWLSGIPACLSGNAVVFCLIAKNHVGLLYEKQERRQTNVG
jgi:hypothetical protein